MATTKDEKPTVAKLARGSVTPGELSSALAPTAEAATFTYFTLNWADGRRATVRNLAELEPIEDPTRVVSLTGGQNYQDGSELTITLLAGINDNSTTAKGQTARERQAALVQAWAVIPGRGRLSARQAFWASNVSQSLALGYSLALIVGWVVATFTRGIVTGSPQTVSGWATWLGFILLALGVHLAIRSTPSVRARSALLVLHRGPSRQMLFWTVVAAVAGVAALLWGIGWGVFTYNHPGR